MEEIRNRSWLRSACAMLAALLVSMIVLNFARSEALTEANARIRAVYQKAFYETCELTESVSVNYRKLLVASGSERMLSLLGEISRQCQGASSNLALLPLGQKTTSATLKFINQAEDFAETLSTKIAAGDNVSSEDYAAMLALSDTAARFTAAMNALLERYENGEAVFEAQDFEFTGDESLYPLSSPASDYPTLLYDGPFSDGITGGRYEMLDGKQEVTVHQAENVLKAFLNVDEIQYLGESDPEIPCYEFLLRSGKYNISAGVTKSGGEVLYLLPEGVQPSEKLSAEQLCVKAEDFLRAKGYGDVEMSYYSAYAGILTINFAAKQDDIILYPDLIKLQLSMEDGAVIGMDARGYLKNHKIRSFETPAIDASAAMDAVGDRLSAKSVRLCIIPQNREEYLCYEISAADGSDTFLVYIDAQNGSERELMQLLTGANGTLVM